MQITGHTCSRLWVNVATCKLEPIKGQLVFLFWLAAGLQLSVLPSIAVASGQGSAARTATADMTRWSVCPKTSSSGDSCTLAHRLSVFVCSCVHQSSWKDELDHNKWFLLTTACRFLSEQNAYRYANGQQSVWEYNHWLTLYFWAFWDISLQSCALLHPQALRLALQALGFERVGQISSPDIL